MICYTFIRQDMDIQHQLVQAAHSSLEAGYEFKDTDTIPFLICLGMKSGKELAKAERYLDSIGIKYHKFFEPDNNLGYTSITTEPLSKSQKALFKRFRLWTFRPELTPSHIENKELACS